MLEYLVKQ